MFSSETEIFETVRNAYLANCATFQFHNLNILQISMHFWDIIATL